MEPAKIIRQNKVVFNVDNNSFDDIDLTQFSDEELIALGIDPSTIEREKLPEEPEGPEDPEDPEEPPEEPQDPEEPEEPEEPVDPEDKDIRIPKSRFDEAVQKERAKLEASEQRNQELMDQVTQLLTAMNKKPEPEIVEDLVDIDELETKYADALLNGETAEAVKIKKQINAEQNKLITKLVNEAKTSAKEEVTNEVTATSEKERKQQVINKALVDYPFLDADHADYNEDIVEEINILAAGYHSLKNVSYSEALQKAVDKIAKPLAKKPSTPPSKPITDERKKEKARKMAQEPPKAPSSSIKDTPPDSYDWDNMSEQEFERIYRKHPEIVNDYLKSMHI